MSEQREALAEVIRVECFYGGLAENAGDYRRMADALLDSPALARLLADAEQRGADRVAAAVEALAEKWRYKGEFGWGAWQEGEGPDFEGQVLDQAAADLRVALTTGAADRVRAEEGDRG